MSMEGNPKALKTLAFSIPADQTFLSSQDPTEHLIWAYSKNRPEKSPQADISFHYRVGLMELKFGGNPANKPTNTDTSPNAESSSTESVEQPGPTLPNVLPFSTGTSYGVRKYKYIMIAHGVLVSFGFLVLLPAGSLIARWSRSFTPKWFKAHQTINMSFALPLITVGWILGPTSMYNRRAMHLSDTHHIGGVLLAFLYYLQITLGRYIHKRRANASPGISLPNHPPLNILHVALGLSIIVGAFAQTRSGFEEWKRATGAGITGWCYVLWKMGAAVTLLAYLAGTILLRRQFHQERQASDSCSGDYRALPPADVNVVLDAMDGGSPRKL
ncbi:hypothetical protein DXG03_005163 [Asterophora parasitica]|uniref:Cytochrome b561 domain-containing protein n=1 Tax=Asterophora parasitica TaxID=117018 RepID=A0A9P7GF23_9AGAR|nr:hypothetical protein DXG03_005163 [Asterophora parasitica]